MAPIQLDETDPNLIAIWRLDETGVTDNAADSVNAWTGVNTHSVGHEPAVATGKFGKARTIGDSGGWTQKWLVSEVASQPRPSSFTIVCWYRPENTGNIAILSKLTGAGLSAEAKSGSSIKPSFAISFTGDGGGLTSMAVDVALTVGRWHHLAFVFTFNVDGKIYVDGVLAKSGLKAGSIDYTHGAAGDWQIGPGTLGGTESGTIDELGFYNVAKPAAFIRSIALGAPTTLSAALQSADGPHRRLFLKIDGLKDVLWQEGALIPNDADGTPVEGEGPPGPHPVSEDSIALWRLDEYASTADAVDDTGNGHTGAQTGAPPTATGNFLNWARSFATGDYFTVTTAAALRPERFTLATWIYPLNTAQLAQACLFRVPAAAGDSIRVDTDTTDNKFGCSILYDDLSSGTVTPANALSANAWHHVAVTWDGTTITLYHDGVAVDTDTAGSGLLIEYATPGDINIGNDDSDAAADFFDGRIDDMAYYNSAKSAEWVRRAYNGGVDYNQPGVQALLRPDAEISEALSIQEMDSLPSNMTMELINYTDPLDPNSHPLAKLFAPGRWESDAEKNAWVKRSASAETQIEANDNVLYTNPNTQGVWDSAGEGHFGNETFSYTGITADQTAFITGEKVDRFDGVTRGIYPCVGTATEFTRAVKLSTNDGGAGGMGDNIGVSTVPYSWIGRRCALYMTAWDSAERKWYPEADAELRWCGTISEEIAFDPGRGVWQLSAEHISALTDQALGQTFFAETYVTDFNLEGPAGLRFVVYEYDFDHATDYQRATADITLTAGKYGGASLIGKLIEDALNTPGNWTGSHGSGDWSVRINPAMPDRGWQVLWKGAGGLTFHFQTFVTQDAAIITGPQYHNSAFLALGFDSFGHFNDRASTSTTHAFELRDDEDEGASSHFADARPYDAFHPLHSMTNGLTIYLYEADARLKADQGGYATGRAYVAIGEDGEDSTYFAITAIKPSSDPDECTLSVDQPWQPNQPLVIGQRRGDQPVRAQQVMVLEYPFAGDPSTYSATTVGPYKALLFSLLSTGTTDYNNSTYDKSPLGIAVGMQDDLVDIPSFDDADAIAIGASSVLAERTFTVINEPTTWRELWKAEAKLFGIALVWDRGKIRAKSILNPAIDATTATLNDSSTAKEIEHPRMSMSTSHIVNQWEVELFDRSTRKWQKPITINDVASVFGVGNVIKTIKIKNSGIFVPAGNDTPQAELLKLFLRGRGLLRFPWQQVTVSLSADQMLKVNIADIVTFVSTNHPDPYGDGTMNTTALALVTNVRWNYASDDGSATLLLFAFPASIRPWAAAAVFDATATNAGWDATEHEITTLAQSFGTGSDSDDAARFASGDKVVIMERCPDDPFNPTTGWPTTAWNATVASAYETDGAGILTVDAITLTGFDNTREYFVTHDVHGTALTSQTDTNTYQASTVTGKLPSNTKPNRYG
ncbi:MAG: LamG-like jellyroll fold domain-containing protein [Dehalococcoidales bacterium]